MFEIGEKGQAIHDVWIEDGIAYSSNWKHGVYMIDVGNGVAGGSPSNPVAMANYSYESGAHHATFPFKSKSTDKFYTVLGCLLYTSPSPRDKRQSRMPSSA